MSSTWENLTTVSIKTLICTATTVYVCHVRPFEGKLHDTQTILFLPHFIRGVPVSIVESLHCAKGRLVLVRQSGLFTEFIGNIQQNISKSVFHEKFLRTSELQTAWPCCVLLLFDQTINHDGCVLQNVMILVGYYQKLVHGQRWRALLLVLWHALPRLHLRPWRQQIHQLCLFRLTSTTWAVVRLLSIWPSQVQLVP